MVKSILQQYLDEYPRFLTQDENSNQYKFVSGLATLIKDLSIESLKYKLSRDINRPLMLWREQNIDYNFSMHWEIHLPDIKRVKLYKYGTGVVYDSGELTTGTNVLSSYDDDIGPYNDSSATKIPTAKYWLEVEDWHDRTLKKGFPENATLLQDIYDIDTNLDIIGKFFKIPRLEFDVTGLTESEYPYTYPPFNNSVKEWDRSYQQRIKQYMEEYGTKKLSGQEVEKYFTIYPEISGRWRYICKMGNGIPDDPSSGDMMFNAVDSPTEPRAKYMATPEWNPSVYDILTNLDEVPPNISSPSGIELQNIINKLIPISKKAYYIIKTSLHLGGSLVDGENNVIFPGNHDIISDYVNIGWLIDKNSPITSDKYLYDVTAPLEELPIDIADSWAIENNLEESLALNDEITFKESSITYYHTSNTDFANDSLDNCSVVGTGEPAYIKLDSAASGYETEVSASENGGVSNRGMPDNNDWRVGSRRSPLPEIHVADNSGILADTSPTYRYTSILRVTNWGFNIPTNAVITGVRVRWRKEQSGTVTVHDDKVILVYNSSERGSDKGTTTKWPQSYTTITYGSSTSTWSANLTPAIVNHSSFGVDLSGYNGSSYGVTLYTDFVDMTVYYTGESEGTVLSQTISVPSGSDGWETLEAGVSIPSVCDITWDVLKASDNSVLLSGIRAPFDLQELDNIPLKLKAFLHTDNPSYYPYLYWFRLRYIKIY